MNVLMCSYVPKIWFVLTYTISTTTTTNTITITQYFRNILLHTAKAAKHMFSWIFFHNYIRNVRVANRCVLKYQELMI